MARTVEELKAKIAELRNAQRNTRARNGYYHYEEKISHLKGELMLLRELTEEEREDAGEVLVQVGTGMWVFK